MQEIVVEYDDNAHVLKGKIIAKYKPSFIAVTEKQRRIVGINMIKIA
jgi:hypothetical protein